MTNLINAPALTRTYLLANSTLATLVSNRIWVGKVPEGELASMPRKALMLLSSSTVASIDIPEYRQRIDAYCYGNTELEAEQVYIALYNALQRCGLQTVDTDKRIMNAWLTGGPTSHTERIVGWPRVWAAFLIVWAEQALA